MVTTQDHSQTHMLVIGAGSIGRRHATNLVSLGASVDIFDVDQNLAKQVSSETGCGMISDLDAALQKGHYQGALVCTPNHLHIPIARKVAEASINLFIEKPLSNTFDGIDSLLATVEENDLVGMAGFNMRYEPGLQYIKKILKPEEVAFARIEFGSYLPMWRPRVDYRKTYSANRSMGGGIILDDVHELDYVCWLFGYPEHVTCSFGRFGNLEIDVEDTAEFILQYNGIMVSVHCDYLQRKYTRHGKICYKNGDTLEWVFGESVTINSEIRGLNFSYIDQFKTNDMYLAEINEFIECVEQKRKPESNLENAARIMEIALSVIRGKS